MYLFKFFKLRFINNSSAQKALKVTNKEQEQQLQAPEPIHNHSIQTIKEAITRQKKSTMILK